MGNIHTVGPNEALIVSGKYIFAHLYIKADKFDRAKRIDVARKTIVSLHFSENIV